MTAEMMTYITGVAHVGVAVPDIASAAEQYRLLGFVPLSEKILFEESHGVQAYMMENNGFVVELLAPLQVGKESPVDSYIETKPYKMYHVAYKVSDFDGQIQLLKQHRFMLTSQPTESAAQGGKRTAFMANRKFGVIELVEE